MRPVTGVRFTWQSNTLMKIETRGSGVVPSAELRRRHRIGDEADAAVGRRDHEPFGDRRHARRVAEEIRAPERQHRAEPAERRPQDEQHEARERKAADERIAFRVDRRELRADGVDDGHALLTFPSPRRGEGGARSAPGEGYFTPEVSSVLDITSMTAWVFSAPHPEEPATRGVRRMAMCTTVASGHASRRVVIATLLSMRFPTPPRPGHRARSALRK